jgi:hypothetical protein
MTTIAHDLGREAHRGVYLRIVGGTAAIGGDRRIIELREFAEICMSRQTIVAAVDFGDGEHKALSVAAGRAPLFNAPHRAR